jgi:hypothetical protein
MKQIMLYIWQMPQHLLALLLIKIFKATKCASDGIEYWVYDDIRVFSGVSLGKYILLPARNCGEITIRHEAGHSKQSKILGPLYLPIIGIYSSLFCNVWDRLFHKEWVYYDRAYWYYLTRWTEKWADKLGEIANLRASWIMFNYVYLPECRFPKLKSLE